MSRAVVLIVLACACSKAKEAEPRTAPPPPPPADATRTDAAVDAGADAAADAAVADAGATAAAGFDFAELSHHDKTRFMRHEVMRTMKPLFRKFDPTYFRKFTCKTCHGKDPKRVKFEMPSPDLPVLDFAAIKAGKADPDAIEFMSRTVTPEMARLLNVPEKSDAEPKGFGCLGCHTEKKK